MITTYLRLDLFKRSHYFDSIDVNANEDILDLLIGIDDANYAELVLVSEFGSNKQESLTACFRRSKIKDKKDYQWILTMERLV